MGLVPRKLLMSKSTLAKTLAFAIASLTAISVSVLQGNSIRGKVRNSMGQNLARVIVNLETGNGSPVNTTVTNNEGDFAFGGLSETSYIITISSPDYNEVREHVDFIRTTSADAPGEQRTVEVTLTPKGTPSSVAINPPNRTISGQNVPKAARDALDRSLKLSRENKTDDAIAALNDALKIFPDYFDAHLLLAGEMLRQNRLDEAIAQFELARKVNPNDDRVYQGFGQVLVKQKKYALASQVFAEAARLNPADSTILLMRSAALIEHALAQNPAASKTAANERQTAFDAAEKDLKKTVDLGGKNVGQAYLQLARLYEKRGERDKAASALESYLKAVPEAKNASSVRDAIKTLRMPASSSKP